MIELLSPAGNIESLKSAVYNRADAVYLGLEQFNARIKADNFTTQNIKQWVDFCHIYSVKVYVTINTLIKDKELDALRDCIAACSIANVDAFIITDYAVIDICQELAPNIPLHASTQLGIHNYFGAKFAERLGFKRIVLSRESTIEDIVSIKKYTSLEIEYFVHGAMCVSFSGGCLLSSIASSNSGNRGLCLQPCRKLYRNTLNDKEAYYLSPKDQCLIANLQALINAGVDSFKIEGRLKSSEYVSATVRAYRKMIDTKSYANQDIIDMKKTFNRGDYSNGYAFSQPNQLMYKSNQSHIGVPIGEIIDCKLNKKNFYDITIRSSHQFSNGDGCKIILNDTELGGFQVNIIKSQGDRYTLFTKDKYPIGAKVRLTYDSALSNNLLAVGRQIELKLKVVLNQSELNISTTIQTFGGERVLVYTIPLDLEVAINNPLTESELINQFSKCGNTPFELCIYAEIYGDFFIPKSLLNQLRRDYIDWLTSQIIYHNSIKEIKAVRTQNFALKFPELSDIIVELGDNLDINSQGLNNVDIVLNFDKIDEFITNNPLIENNIYIKLPKLALFKDIDCVLAKLNELKLYKWFKGIYAENLYVIEISIIYNLPIIMGFGLNFLNSLAPKKLSAECYALSTELNIDEIITHRKTTKKLIIYAYGYLPIMTLAHCPIINILGCKCTKCEYKPFKLIDNYGEYKIKRNKNFTCIFTMYNSVCHNLLRNTKSNKFIQYIDLSCIENLFDGDLRTNISNYGCISREIKFTDGHITRGVK